MQNKGLVILFAVLFGLVSIYQLSFTFKGNAIENNVQHIAEGKFDKASADYSDQVSNYRDAYLDSLQNSKESVFLGNTFSDVKSKSINLGLDLKGGVNAILQISVKDILKGLANDSKDPTFDEALENADELQKNSQNDYIEDFYIAFDAIKGDKKLASPDIFATRDLEEEIPMGMADSDVKRVITRKIDESVDSAFRVLRERIDQFGVSSPNIQRLGSSARILVELPGVKDKERAIDLIGKTARLEFWEVETAQLFNGFIGQANQLIKSREAKKEDATTETSTSTSSDDDLINKLTGVENDSLKVEANPFTDLLMPTGSGGLFSIDVKNKELVESYLNDPQVRALLPAELRATKFLFGKQESESPIIDLYAIKGSRDGKPELTGDVITDARNEFDANGVDPVVSMQMDSKGAKLWEDMTEVSFKQRSPIAVVLDDVVYSAPVANNGKISGGRTQISGNFTLNEAKDLANVLRAGKLPARADIIQSEVVGPSLGKEAIASGKMSFMIALALVLLWMFFYYGKAGLFADIAMILNIVLIFGILSGLGAVLTLPGIAGIVLTIGMSVDANVLIFERIREELQKGKDQKLAIKDGFGNALSSILDANVTTGLTALILFVFGTGPIKGFATTLIIGIVTSLFTAIFITRLLVDWYVNRGGKLDFSTSITKNLFRNIDIAFLKKRKMAYVISGIAILLSLGSLFMNGLDQGVDFVGGRTYQVRFADDINSADVSAALSKPEVFGSADAKTFGDSNQLKITTKFKVNETGNEVDDAMRSSLFTALKPYLKGVTYEDFISNSEAKQVGLLKEYKVSPTIADDIKQASVWAILGSLIVVFLYILFRFKRWQFSLGAVAAVFHDVLIVLGVFSITYKFMPFSMEIDQAFIAAILTVIGYSLNDTVVVFDRIREFFNDNPDWPFSKVIDTSLSSTLSRTLNTSLTTLVVLLAIFIFGGDSIRGFMFALIVGVIVGTYSSLFIATPLMYDSVKRGGATDALKAKVKEDVIDETVVK